MPNVVDLREWDEQPQELTLANRASPLTENIRALFSGNLPFDLVNGVMFPRNLLPEIVASSGGLALKGSGATTSSNYWCAPEQSSTSRSSKLYDIVAPPITLFFYGYGDQNAAMSLVRGNGSGGPAYGIGSYYGSFSGGYAAIRTSGGSISFGGTSFVFDSRLPMIAVLSVGATTTRFRAGRIGQILESPADQATPTGNFYYEHDDAYRCLTLGGSFNQKGSLILGGIVAGEAWSDAKIARYFENPWRVLEPEEDYSYFSAAGGTAYNQSIAGILSFSGVRAGKTSRLLTAVSSFVGGVQKITGRSLSATQGFVGTAAKHTVRLFGAGLSFLGAIGTAGSQKLASIYVGMLGKATSRLGALSLAGKPGAGTYLQSLTAALSFVGALPKRTSRVFSAAVAFVGTLTRAFPILLSATLGLSGAVSKHTSRAFTATASFAGALLKRTSRAFTATASFTGVLIRAFPVLLSATLGFSGSITKKTNRALAAVLSFSGSMIRRIPVALSASMSFVGSVAKTTARTLVASVGFSGVMTVVRLITMALTATLSFVGTRTQLLGKVFTAALGFTGVVSKRTSRAISATQGFIGAVSKRTSRALAAALSFAGSISISRLITKALTATLSFAGALPKRANKTLVAAVSWIGAVATVLTSSVIQKALSATLSFSGVQSKRTAHTMASTLSFVGVQGKRISRAFSAFISFVGSVINSFFLLDLPKNAPDIFVLRGTTDLFLVRHISESLIIQASTDIVVEIKG